MEENTEDLFGKVAHRKLTICSNVRDRKAFWLEKIYLSGLELVKLIKDDKIV